MKAMVYGEPDNWKQLRPVRWGDAVLSEPSEARFLPCGTTIDAAQKLKRHWIGIDITSLAINLIKTRLLSTYGEGITKTYTVRGEPTTFSEAQALARL